MEKNISENLVASHYDGSSENYHLQYERKYLTDVSRDYPANYFRLHKLINSFVKNNIKNVIEVGVGEGTPLVALSKVGMEVCGFDISQSMVTKAKSNFKENNLPTDKIIFGDIQDPITYSPLLKNGQFDGLLAMGVLPHVQNDEFVLTNMKNIVKPGGRVFIEFRNKFFSLFTFNRNTYDFIMEDLLDGVSPRMKEITSQYLMPRLDMDLPTPRLFGESGNLNNYLERENQSTPGYDAILSKFHNPLEMLDLFVALGYQEPIIHWYHYHPSMPKLSEVDPDLYRNEALMFENNISKWKGMFLCSAFVIEATVPISN